MTGTRKKTYAVVMAVGLAGLLLDRLVFPEPQSADAATVAPAPGPEETAEAVAARTLEALTASPFPRNLPEPVLPLPRDGFGLTASITRAMQQNTAPESGADSPHEAPGNSASQFEQEHQLSAVMRGDNIAVAVVNGEWVQLGQYVDECKLTDITGRSALFECRDGIAEITVADR